MNDRESRRLRLQKELDALRTRRERNAMGQFATPAPLALEILQSALDLAPSLRAPLRFLDPAFGTGAFHSALLRTFPPDAIAAAYGCEIDPHYGAPAAELWRATGLRLKLADFTTLRPGDGDMEPVDLLVCNPPYVRHHHIEKRLKKRLVGDTMARLGIRVSGLAGLYVHFVLLSHRWLAQDGLSIWLIPSEFMDVNYGSALKEYLLHHVDLLRIHRFDPEEVQFEDALVSSAVVWFRNRRPDPESAPEFSLGASVLEPRIRRRAPRRELRRARKWTRFPVADGAGRVRGPVLGDFFDIRRGIATGGNRFFVMDRQKANAWSLPSRFLQPVVPSPRHLTDDVIGADPEGAPTIGRQLFLFRCHHPLPVLEQEAPEAASYVRHGEKEGFHAGYLASRRDPWYALERREPAPFLCTYMGRSVRGGAPFRVVLNQSTAIVTNVYLMLYPKRLLGDALTRESDLKKAWACLKRIVDAGWKTNCRVYGGGLYKVEPRELAHFSAEVLCDAFPDLRAARSREIPPGLFGDRLRPRRPRRMQRSRQAWQPEPRHARRARR